MITRAPRPTSNFYLLDKAISEDNRLSWSARGLLIFLLGKPDHWTVSPAALVNETAKSSRSMGRDGVYAVLKELKEVGYLHTIGTRNDGGTFAGSDYMVSESPHTEKPDTVDSPDTANPDTASLVAPRRALPDTANPTQVSIEAKQGLIGKQGLKSASAHTFDISASLLSDYLAVRKAKKAGPLTDTAIAGLQREADKAGVTLTQAVTACCEFGWQGFRADWYTERTTRKPAAMTASRHTPPVETFAERDARNKREAWEAMTGRKWPEQDLPSTARSDVIEAEINLIRRIA